MGLFDWLPCCGPRKRHEGDKPSPTESATLLPPTGRADSILSSEGVPGYGTIEAVPGGLTDEQLARIEQIGREVGNSMLPIDDTRSPNLFRPNANQDPSTVPSPNSSRPSSPSPARPSTSPPGGAITSPDPSKPGSTTEGQGSKPEGETEGEVVQKRLFVNGGKGNRKASGRGKGKGKGKGRR